MNQSLHRSLLKHFWAKFSVKFFLLLDSTSTPAFCLSLLALSDVPKTFFSANTCYLSRSDAWSAVIIDPHTGAKYSAHGLTRHLYALTSLDSGSPRFCNFDNAQLFDLSLALVFWTCVLKPQSASRWRPSILRDFSPCTSAFFSLISTSAWKLLAADTYVH